MEDIYSFIINQRHLIETEYYKLKSQENDFHNLDLNNVQSLYDSIGEKIGSYNLELNNLNIIQQQENEKKKSELKNKKTLYLTQTDIENLLDSYDDGTYGIINYYEPHDFNKLIKYILDAKYEFHNKPTLVSKLIKNSKPTQEAINDSYGILFMYKKEDDQINNLNKVYLLKNNDINNLNCMESSDKDDDLDDKDIVITKIYEFSNKIVLKEIIYESNFNQDNVPSQVIKTDKMIELETLISDTIIKKNQLDNLNKLSKKYKKYIDDNIKSDDLKIFLNNYSFIKNLIKKITDPTKKQLDINNVLKFDFSQTLDNIRISNRYDENEYENLIYAYFEESIQELTNSTLESYDINPKFKDYMYKLFDVLIRIYIDNHLGYKSYCLSKTYSEYFDFNALLIEPETNSLTLKRRYWNQLLDSLEFNESIQKVLSSLLMLIKTKTKTLESTLKYFNELYKNSSLCANR